MGKWFDIDSPLIQFLNKVADLMWLNILTLLCCIPIITAGAALTSAHYVALKLHRNEEGYITRDFLRSFKMNFKQSTAIWLIILLVLIVFSADFYIMKNVEEVNIPTALQVVIMAIAILFLFMVIWVFAVQAKFVNTVTKTIKNAFALSVIQLPKTILMAVLYVLPYVLCIFSLRLFPVILVLGISVPVYVSAVLYNKMFKKLEDKIMERLEGEKAAEGGAEPETEETEKIFSDTPILDETNQDS